MMKYIFFLFGVTLILPFFSGCNSQENPESANHLKFAIAYNVLVNDSTDNYEVFTMNLDGSEKSNITHLPGVEWTYYAYQDNLFFISDKDTCQRCAYFLYETDYSGSSPQKISTIPLADSWMSSRNGGQELIVKPHSRMDTAFYIVDMEGQVKAKLRPNLPMFSDPLFVDDGQKVVFRGGSKKSKREPGYQEELYIINVDGTDLRQITQYPAEDTTAAWFAYKAGPPKQHPTEKFISYQSYQNGKYSLYATTLDGTKHWKLTDNPEEEGWHDWSPDGKMLAIELFDKDQSQFHIGLMNWEDKELKILTDSTYKYQQAPNFVMKTD